MAWVSTEGVGGKASAGGSVAQRGVEFGERNQIAIYLLALVAGGGLGFAAPAAGAAVEHAIYPVLGTLLYATFLQVPFTALGRAMRGGRFLVAVLVLNFVLVPVVVYGLTRFLPDDRVVLLGVLLVLLTPCVDYVIVFSGLVGGSADRLLAATPLLMLAQMALLPLYLLIFLGPDLATIVDPDPFLEAFVILIIIPLVLAWGTQTLATRHRAGQVTQTVMTAAMVPLMAATLLTVVASQTPQLASRLGTVAGVVPLYGAFLVIMAGLGLLVARCFRLDVPGSRALIFTGATRNSLVVLPLALALPDPYALAAVIVVSQTLVELVGMVLYVQLIPRLVPARAPHAAPSRI